MKKKITPIDLLTKLEKAGIPVHGTAEDGRIDFKDEATPEQREAAAAILTDYDQDVEDEAKVAEATKGRVTEEEIEAAKTVGDLKALLKKLIKGK
jgi:cell division protein FtsN